MSKKEINKLFESTHVFIPTTILKDRTLSVLESIVEYLKDQKQLTFHEIAILLNRDDRTIWTCYSRAKKKRKWNFRITMRKV